LANRRADPALRSDALKFLVHFVGDIHQPLHTEGFAAGANGILVTFMGRKTNLHAVWDVWIPFLPLTPSPSLSCSSSSRFLSLFSFYHPNEHKNMKADVS